MSLLEALLLGIVQGLTEFLPVSSSGHLRIVPALLGSKTYFRRDLSSVASTWFSSLRDPSLRGELDARMGWYLIAGTVPISLAGVAIEGPIETSARDL